MHMELYLDAAQRILDRALIEGDKPAAIRWRFEMEEGEGDDHRVRLPDKQNPIVHGGKNALIGRCRRRYWMSGDSSRSQPRNWGGFWW